MRGRAGDHRARDIRPFLWAVILAAFHPAAGGRAALGAEGSDFSSPGPYPVGARTVVLIDGSRKDEFAGGPRTLVTEIWYPASESARGMPRMKFSEFFGPYRALGSKALKRDLQAIDADFKTLAVRDVEPGTGTWPLLIFSHGNGGFRHQNAFQVEHLASHGYVVASPDHTGNSSLTPLPGGAVGYDRKGRGRSSDDRPIDVRFLIDRLLQAEDREISFLRGRLDPEAIGVLGHSFGGFTAVRAVTEDPRIKAILPMTVAFVGRPTSIPTLVMLGGQDMTVGLPGNLLSRGYYLGCTGQRFLFVLKRGGHFSFTDMAVINPNFGDGIGRGKGRDGKTIDFIPVPLAKEIINSYSLAFFDSVLKGSGSARAYLEGNHYPEELEWWVQDREITVGYSKASEPAPPRTTPPKRTARF